MNAMLLLIYWIALCYVTTGALPNNAETPHHGQGQGHVQYAVILDAGSSGSRVHVYNWTQRSNPRQLPRFNRTNFAQPHSALSDYAYRLTDIRRFVVEPLLGWAKDKIPSGAWPATSVYVLATAGG